MMNKKVIGTLLLCTCFSNLKAQNLNTELAILKKSKGHIGVQVGPSFPVSDFGSNNSDDPESGLANNGVLLGLSAAYELGSSGISLITSFRRHFIPLDERLLQDELISQTLDTDWTVRSKGWRFSSFLVGLYETRPITDKLKFDTYAMAGLLRSQSPEVVASFNGWNGSGTIETSSMGSSSLAWSIGAGVTYELDNRTFFTTHLDYMSSRPRFENVATRSNNGSATLYDFTQKVNIVNLSIGLAFGI